MFVIFGLGMTESHLTRKHLNQAIFIRWSNSQIQQWGSFKV